MTEQLLTLDQVAARLQVSMSTIRRRVKAGELRVVRIGRQIRVRPEDFDAFVANHADDGEKVEA